MFVMNRMREKSYWLFLFCFFPTVDATEFFFETKNHRIDRWNKQKNEILFDKDS